MSDCCNEFEFTSPQGTFYMDGGIRGKDGVTFYPHVSAAGILSWTNDGGKQNPDPVNIKGEDGMSAYAAAQQAGFTGTEQEFNAYLAGIGELTEDVDDLKSAVDAVSMFEEYLPEKFEDTRFNRKVTICKNKITIEKTGSDSTTFCHYSLFGHKYLGTGSSVPTSQLTDEDFISFTPYSDAFILQRFTTFVSSNIATAYYVVTKNQETEEIKSAVLLNSNLGTSRTANMFEILPDIISNGNFGIVFTSRHNRQNITENFWIRTTMRTSLANITGNILATYKANKAYAIGDVLIVAGLLYRVTAAIANGAQLIPNTNIVKTTVADLIKLSNS